MSAFTIYSRVSMAWDRSGTLVERFVNSPSDVLTLLELHANAPPAERCSVLLADLTAGWKSGNAVSLDNYFANNPKLKLQLVQGNIAT